jgi:predicted dehydrogenase
MTAANASRSTTTNSRREFLKTSGLAAGATALGGLNVARFAHGAGKGGFKIGLIGCGGRGSGAAVNAMNAGPDIKLVAMADIFDDRLQGARQRLKKIKPEQVAVADDYCFVGFDAYQKLLATDIDVVLIACASHFHPAYFKAAVEAGKNIFCEKPHGLDVPGLKVAMAANEEAKKKGLAVLSGLCWRFDVGVREAMKRVQDGQIGDIIAIEEKYVCGPYIVRERKPEWTEMYYQYQNWYHFNWLSGDQTAQQLIHSMDKASWAMGDVPPVKAWGLGGRQVCLDPKYGDQFDHHAVVYEYANGVKVFAYCRDQLGCYSETADTIFGTKGRAILPSKPRIEGQKPWQFQTKQKTSMTDNEQKALFDSLRAGKPINCGHYMFTSSMLAILAQMVCYTGQEITWEKAMSSKLSYTQPRYAFDAQPPVKPDANGLYPTAMPGITKFA